MSEANITQAGLHALEARLERTERELRLLRAVVLLAAVATTCAVLGPAQGQGKTAKPKPLKVTKVTAPFQVVDSSGRLMFMVQNGRPGPEVQVFGSAGRPVVVFGSDQKGGGGITLTDRNGKTSFQKP
jgi:hypothetical protein